MLLLETLFQNTKCHSCSGII